MAWAGLFQGTAPGESKGGFPAILKIPGGGGSTRILVVSMVKMKEFSGEGGMLTPMNELSNCTYGSLALSKNL